MNQIAQLTGIFLATISIAIARAEEATEADYRAFAEFLDGEWEFETQGISGTIRFSMSPTKGYLTSSAQIGEDPVMHAIEGYDAEQKCWKRVLFWVRGGHVVVHTKFEESAAGKSIEERALKGEAHDVDSGGQGRDSKVVYRIVDKNTWQVEREDGMIVYTRRSKD